MTNAQIILPQGDSRQVAVTVYQPGGKLVRDLTGSVFTMVVKKNADDTAPLLTKSSTVVGQIDISAPTTGKLTIKLVAGDTTGLAPGTYVWSLRGVWSSTNEAYTLLAGNFVVVEHP